MTVPAGSDLLAKVNTFPPHSTQAYLVTVLSISQAGGTCTVDPGDGDTLTEVPFFGSLVVDTVAPMLLFDGQLAVLGLGQLLTFEPAALTAAAGWSVVTSSARWDANFCFLYFNVTRTGAQIPAATRGNITNSLAATLASNVPSPRTLAGAAMIGGSMLIGAALTDTGLLNVVFAPPGQPINTGDGFNGSVTYPI